MAECKASYAAILEFSATLVVFNSQPQIKLMQQFDHLINTVQKKIKISFQF